MKGVGIQWCLLLVNDFWVQGTAVATLSSPRLLPVIVRIAWDIPQSHKYQTHRKSNDINQLVGFNETKKWQYFTSRRILSIIKF